MKVAGFTSTGSKRPEALFGESEPGLPLRMVQSSGCRVQDANGKEYLDYIMALGSVALGYGHPEVNRAVIDAVQRGAIGPVSPIDEAELAAELGAMIPMIEEIRFLKTGAEAVAAAVRLARVATGRDQVLGCGYHGWLDWCSDNAGVPAPVRALYGVLPFNDVEGTVELIRRAGDTLACVVMEPVVEAPPSGDWLRAVREETRRVGAVLVFDEIKTAFRVGLSGAAARWGGEPDLVVLGKALANGFPLAAVGGSSRIMQLVSRTWISSTMATEFVSFAAARATLRVVRDQNLPERLDRLGSILLAGLKRLAERFPRHIAGVGGIPEMCYLRYRDEEFSQRVAQDCARRGLLFKRTAYNFVSLAHDESALKFALDTLEEVLTTDD
ncbi:MAG TPA: aminotransferase class III-fold pyridoxal phosphate-dependent enzyme [Gemmatimonadales bacterium]